MSYSLLLPDWPAEEPEPSLPCFFCGEDVLWDDDVTHEALPIGIVHTECSEENEAGACCQCGTRDVYLDPTTDLCEYCEDTNARDSAADAALDMYFEESA